VDKALFGGFVIRLADTVIDTSLKSQLEKMRRQMATGGQ
jgi:F0F1-type ATP synthase delta subunit